MKLYSKDNYKFKDYNIKDNKKNLEEINTLIKTNTEDINNIKLKVEELILGQEKIFNDNPNFIKRLESLTKDILTIKENFPEIVGTTPTVKNEYHTKVEEINNIDTMNEENDKKEKDESIKENNYEDITNKDSKIENTE